MHERIDRLVHVEDASLGDDFLEEEQLAGVVSTIGAVMTHYPANEGIQRNGVSALHSLCTGRVDRHASETCDP